MPVEEFLLSLDKKMRAKILGIMGIIQEKEKQSREPYSKHLDDELGVKRMRKYDDFLAEQLQDEEFKKEYDDLQPEFDVIRAIVEARVSQNLTQKQLAERSGINQADISKLENGTRNPSINLLKRLAEGMDMALKIEFIPKKRV